MDLSERGSATDRHPWEIERFRAYRAILAEHGALSARRVLDVGAGDGWFSESLLDSLPAVEQVVCWDINYNELELHSDDPRLVRTTSAPPPGFDLVLVLDVLEHIADPRRFIEAELRPLTAPGTAVLVSVPAHPRLFGEHDRALGHFRRYRSRELISELSGWIEIVDHGPLFVALVAPRAAAVTLERLLGRRRPTSQQIADDGQHGVGGWQGGAVLTRVVRSALALDVAATRRLGNVGRHLPGLSHWVYGVVT